MIQRFVATVELDNNNVLILDIRVPITPFMGLSKHRTCVNAMSWSPDFGRHLCSISDDARVFIWEVMDTGFRSGNGCDVEPVMWQILVVYPFVGFPSLCSYVYKLFVAFSAF